jgi:KUP system potassium uptake protein
MSVPDSKPSLGRTLALTLGALGVVYGDIGTSPLYAMRAAATAAGGDAPGAPAVYGALSLIFWSLLVVVTLKYVFLILRADNNGEGGAGASRPRLARRQDRHRPGRAAGPGAVLWRRHAHPRHLGAVGAGGHRGAE